MQLSSKAVERLVLHSQQNVYEYVALLLPSRCKIEERGKSCDESNSRLARQAF